MSDSPRAPRSTRRTATVTISAPDASSAARVCAMSRYLPVPTKSRDANRCAPIEKASSISSSAYELHDLESIAFVDARLRVLGAGNDLGVALDCDELIAEAERVEQRRHGGARCDVSILPIDHDPHHWGGTLFPRARARQSGSMVRDTRGGRRE